MPRFCGTVTYAESKETSPGIWELEKTVRKYYGDVLRNTRRLEKQDSRNDNLNVNNSISIVADAYAYEHFFAIRSVNWMGVDWKVTTVDVQRPRLILSIGDVCNDE